MGLEVRRLMLVIDGSQGEGGGQILRTALSAAMITGIPFRIEAIRAGRRRPGLRPQHLAAVKAAAAVAAADVVGDEIGSADLEFHPGPVRPGRHRFDIGTAGSAVLVAQTVLPGLLIAEGPSDIEVIGGTHNAGAPPFEFFAHTFLPVVSRTGARLRSRLHRHGFYPAGGGRLSVTVSPPAVLRPVELMDGGETRGCTATALLSQLPRHIAERELSVVRQELGWTDLETREVDADGPGNALILTIEYGEITTVVSSVGRRGLPAETVAARAVAEAQAYLDHDAPVGPHLADQLLLPLALAGGTFRTSAPTRHFSTNADVVRRFLSTEIEIAPDDGHVLVTLLPGPPDGVTT